VKVNLGHKPRSNNSSIVGVGAVKWEAGACMERVFTEFFSVYRNSFCP
jgi:hypothetical protein